MLPDRATPGSVPSLFRNPLLPTRLFRRCKAVPALGRAVTDFQAASGAFLLLTCLASPLSVELLSAAGRLVFFVSRDDVLSPLSFPRYRPDVFGSPPALRALGFPYARGSCRSLLCLFVLSDFFGKQAPFPLIGSSGSVPPLGVCRSPRGSFVDVHAPGVVNPVFSDSFFSHVPFWRQSPPPFSAWPFFAHCPLFRRALTPLLSFSPPR